VPKVNNNPMGENWLNLVTLTVSQKPDSASWRSAVLATAQNMQRSHKIWLELAKNQSGPTLQNLQAEHVH
jgi:hypothetical protein